MEVMEDEAGGVLCASSSDDPDTQQYKRVKRSRRQSKKLTDAAAAEQAEAQEEPQAAAQASGYQSADSGEEGAEASIHTKYVAWTKEEDQTLRQLVARLGPKHWRNIALHMPFRTSKSCRLRWLNQLRPNVQTGSFTPEEDQIIIQTQAQIGNRWTAIAAMLPGRTDNAVKNRWNSALRKRVDASYAAQHHELPHQMQQQQERQQRGHQQQQQQPPEDLKQQQATLMQLLAAGVGAGRRGSAQGSAAPQQGGLGSTSVNHFQLLAMGLQQHKTAQPLGSGLLPSPPPTSTPLVATAPPFQLPMSFMTLQPQMNATEAAAALAAANSGVLKKVTEAVPNPQPAAVTSTAMIGLTPPPIIMSSSTPAAPDLAQHILTQQPDQSQHTSLAHQLMRSQLAASLLQQQQPPASSAMVASIPPPAVMAIPHHAQHAPSTQPAVSWMMASAIPAPQHLPITAVHQPAAQLQQLQHSSVPDANRPVGMVPVKSEKEAETGVGLGLAQQPAQAHTPSLEVPTQSAAQQQQQQPIPAQQQLTPPDLAQLLLLQQQQLQQQHAIMQRLDMHLQAGQQQQQQQLQPRISQTQPAAPQPAVAAPAIPSIPSVPDFLSHLFPTITANAAPSIVANTAAPTGGGSSSSLAAVLEGAASNSGITGALEAVVASGGGEALQHLLTLGIGTFMTAAALRQQGQGVNTLALAQHQMASHPSAQALIGLFFPGAQAQGTMQGDPLLQHSPSGQALAQQHHHQHASGLALPRSGHHDTCQGGFMGSPLGSMSDLVAMFDPGVHGFPRRPG